MSLALDHLRNLLSEKIYCFNCIKLVKFFIFFLFLSGFLFLIRLLGTEKQRSDGMYELRTKWLKILCL
jgi:hypothetical protein